MLLSRALRDRQRKAWVLLLLRAQVYQLFQAQLDRQLRVLALLLFKAQRNRQLKAPVLLHNSRPPALQCNLLAFLQNNLQLLNHLFNHQASLLSNPPQLLRNSLPQFFHQHNHPESLHQYPRAVSLHLKPLERLPLNRRPRLHQECRLMLQHLAHKVFHQPDLVLQLLAVLRSMYLQAPLLEAVLTHHPARRLPQLLHPLVQHQVRLLQALQLQLARQVRQRVHQAP